MLVLLLSSLLCLAVAVPNLSFLAAVFWGIVLVLGGYYTSRSKLLAVFAINILVLYLTGGWGGIGYLLSLAGIPSLIMGLLLARGKGYYELRKWGAISAVLSILFFLGISYQSTGASGVNALQQEVQSYIQEVLDMSKSSEMVQLYEERGISWAEIEASFKSLGRNMVLHLPAILALQAVLAVYIILLGSSLYGSGRKEPILQRKPFREETMPWQLAWLVILGLSLWLWGRDEMSVPYYAGSNILLFMAPLTVYYGLATITCQIGRLGPKGRRWGIAVFIVLTLVFSVPAFIFIGLLGLFDSLLDYRKLRGKKEEER
jgi:uncharacterized protein YybS (DUF2232 family)